MDGPVSRTHRTRACDGGPTVKLRVVGAHNFASSTTRLGCLLVDDHIALDAGSLAVGLSFEEQRLVRHVFISHRHYDHVRDLLVLGLSCTYMNTSIDVYATEATLKAVGDGLFGSGLYPDARSRPSQDKPAVRFHTVSPYEPVSLPGGYTVVATPVVHSVEATGYEVTGPDGRRLFYSGDTGPGVAQAWPHIKPHLIALECTLDNSEAKKDQWGAHLRPDSFGEALVKFNEIHGYMPKSLAVHLAPWFEEGIRRDLPAVARQIGADIQVATEDDVLEV